ncbi:MAG: hypothetical protein WCF36_09450 [Candidatus Nanopelagicales bacterium]
MTDQRPTPVSADSTGRNPHDTSFGLRWLLPAAPWLALGVASIFAGGLLAAVVAHDPTEKAVWASAYLVLVAGLAQVALALARALLAPRPPQTGVLARDFLVLALGNAGVVIGTLTDALWLVDVGGILLVVALGLTVWGTRGGTGLTTEARPTWLAGLLWPYRLLVVILLVSIPIGLFLARR